jgi:PII-like signaling protein
VTGEQRLTILMSSRDRAGHHSLAIEIMSRARRAGMAGATLLHGAEGLGRSGSVHRDRLFVDDAPAAVVIVDDGEKIAAFRRDIEPLTRGAVVLVDDVTAFRA